MASAKPTQEGDLNASVNRRMNVGLSSYNFVPKYFKEEPSALERASNVKADSWVDLQLQQNSGAGSEPTIETPNASIYNGNLEKLLIDAQRESCTPSYANSKESSTRGSGELQMQKLKSHLVRTQILEVLPLKPGVDVGGWWLPHLSDSLPHLTDTSPKSPHSPNTEWASGDWRIKQDPGTDWIWDWSSGPEVQPITDWNEKFRHPAGKPRRMPPNLPKSQVTKSGFFRFENLPTLLLTHACTFFLGAAFMFMYLKKYCNWTVVPSTLD